MVGWKKSHQRFGVDCRDAEKAIEDSGGGSTVTRLNNEAAGWSVR